MSKIKSVKVEITEHEANAYIQLMNDAKVPPEMGYILTTLKYKLLQKFQSLQDELIKKEQEPEPEEEDE